MNAGSVKRIWKEGRSYSVPEGVYFFSPFLMQWIPLAEVTISEWENLEQTFVDPARETEGQVNRPPSH
jgi:hypothetical protein